MHTAVHSGLTGAQGGQSRGISNQLWKALRHHTALGAPPPRGLASSLELGIATIQPSDIALAYEGPTQSLAHFLLTTPQ